ncbi:MAG: RNA-binding protein [Tissierellia bacterium]|nr:RNA-binding protein [Tissierellia bacterium]
MKINRDIYTAHIKDKEKVLDMRKVIDKIEIVINNHVTEATDFFDPYERYLAKSILNRFMEIDYLEAGGGSSAERKIMVIFPSYLDASIVPEYLTYLRIKGHIEGLTHKDYLGAILGLGIKRSKVGDILVHETHTDIILKEEISEFILLNLEKIGNRKVSIEEVTCSQLEEPEITYKEIKKTLSSYRLDVYISAAYNLTRQDSLDLIKSGYVKVNWEPIDKSSKELTEGDIISVRGYGRSILHSVEGVSKKGRIIAYIKLIL